MQRAALAVAKNLGELDDAALAGGEELLAGEFRRRAQIERGRGSVGRGQRSGEGVQMGFVAGRNRERPGLDLDEIVRSEPASQGGRDAHARQQRRTPVGMDVGGPKGRRIGHFVRHNLVGGSLRK